MTGDDESGRPGDADDDRRDGGDDARDGDEVTDRGEPGEPTDDRDPYGDYDPDQIRGPLSGREEDGSADPAASGDLAGIRSSGSNGHHEPEDADAGTAGPDDADRGPDEPWFEEVQRFRQRWVWAAFGLLTAYAVVTVALNDVWAPLAALLVGLPVAALVMLYVAELRTEVDAEGIHLRFVPFHRSPRTIPFEEVVEYEAVEYDPVREYYGWGIRRGLGGWAYNVSGNEGVHVEREPKDDVLVGSQRPDELEDAVARGVAVTDTVAHHGADRGAKWQAVAQFRPDDDRPLDDDGWDRLDDEGGDDR